MKFYLLLCLSALYALAAGALPAPAVPDPAGPKEALLSYVWSYEDVPPNKWKQAWTSLRFHPDGTATAYHGGTEVKTLAWEITDPKTVKIDGLWYSFDDGYSVFQFWPPTGSTLKKGTRGAPVVAQTAAVGRPAPPPPSAPPVVAPSLEVLRKEGPNIVNWTFSPLEVGLPEAFRENLLHLRESLRDDAAKGAAANPAACQLGVRFCDALLAGLTERETRAAEAHVASAAGASGTLGARRADFSTDRKNLPTFYNSNWPVYVRERAEAKDRKGDAAKTQEFFNESAKLQWTNRAAQLRQSGETLYERFREAARQRVTVKE